MAFLGTFMEFILSLCEEDGEMLNAAKEINELSQENTKIENQLEALDQEHNLLHIQLYNTEFLVTIINDLKDAIAHFQQNFAKIYHDSVQLNKLLQGIDFTKILQCHYMEMEKKLQLEWQPLQQAFSKTAMLEEQMEQRTIVQEYREKLKDLEKVKMDYEKDKESMEKSLQQSSEQIQEAIAIRNVLIVKIIKESKDLANVKEMLMKLQRYEEYLEGLKQKKFMLSQNQEQKQLEAFKPNHSNTTRKLSNNSSENNEATQILIPKLPSFVEILQSFKQNETKTTNITTTIENTTEICIKSILHNSNNKQSLTTKQTKNVRFKVQLEKYEEDTTQAIYTEEIESETDIEIEMNTNPNILETTFMEITDSNEEKENLQDFKEMEKESEEIETIDLLTQVENVKLNNEESPEHMENTEASEIIKKSPIHIQECIVIKPPLNISELSKHLPQESEINTSAISKQTENSLTSSSSHNNIKDLLNKTKKSSFFEDFLNISTNSKPSPSNTTTNTSSTSSQKVNKHKTQMILKDFETFFKESNEFLFSSKDSAGEEDEDEKSKVMASNFEINKTDNSANGGCGDMDVDFLDFGSNRGGFVFDSDDNMTMSNKYKSGEMDFM